MPKKHKYLQTLKSTDMLEKSQHRNKLLRAKIEKIKDMLEKSQHRNKLLRAKIEKIKRAEPLLAPPLIFR
jgi:inactivated superfamily I helicase